MLQKTGLSRVGFLILISILPQSVFAVGPKPKHVCEVKVTPLEQNQKGMSEILIHGLAAKKIYNSMSDISEEHIKGVTEKFLRASQNIKCLKEQNGAAKFKYSCSFNLSAGGSISAPVNH